MDRERRQRLALQWGGLALVLQIRLAFLCINLAHTDWDSARSGIGDLAQLTNRASQLKPALFKFPWSGIYLCSFIGAVAVALAWLWIHGMREAMAPEPDAEQK
jgi:hypothetical protein